jgi:hypothetical protein
MTALEITALMAEISALECLRKSIEFALTAWRQARFAGVQAHDIIGVRDWLTEALNEAGRELRERETKLRRWTHGEAA